MLEKWIAHFLGVDVTIAPQREIDDARWVWHVGLDAEASALLNDLYNRVDVDEERMRRLLCLFQLDFADPGDMRPAIAGRPVYLAMAMDADEPAEAEAAESPAQPAARAAAMNAMNPIPRCPAARSRSPAPRRFAATPAHCQRAARRRDAPSPPNADAAKRAAGAGNALAWLEGCWRGAVNQREFREHGCRCAAA